MADTLKLMAILAHPDDESLGNGGILAKYAAEGIETSLVVATRGERGWWGKEEEYPGLDAFGKRREAEVLAAAKVLGLHRVEFLDYLDGELDQADPTEAITKIVGHLRRVRPDVVVTFGPDGAYGHPDHIAICQFTTTATIAAADAARVFDGAAAELPAHAVSKLYYIAWSESTWAAYQEAVSRLSSRVDGVERQATPWP